MQQRNRWEACLLHLSNNSLERGELTFHNISWWFAQLYQWDLQNCAANIRALTQTSGNVNAAVERLLG